MDDANRRRIFQKAFRDIVPPTHKQSLNREIPVECLTSPRDSINKPRTSVNSMIDDVPIPLPKPCAAVNSVENIVENEAFLPRYSLLEVSDSGKKIGLGYSSLTPNSLGFESASYLDDLRGLNQLSIVIPNNQAKMKTVSSPAFKSISENYQSSGDGISSSEEEEAYGSNLSAFEEPEPNCVMKIIEPSAEITPSVYHLMSHISATGKARREAAIKEYQKHRLLSSVDTNSSSKENPISKGKAATTREIRSQSESLCNITESLKVRNSMQKENFSAMNVCAEEVIMEDSSKSTCKSLHTISSPMNVDSHAVNRKSSLVNVDSETKENVADGSSSPVGTNSNRSYCRNEVLDKSPSVMGIPVEGETSAPGSLRKKPKVDASKSFSDDYEMTNNRSQSSFNENDVSNKQKSPYTTPKRPFWAMYGNDSQVQSKSDQTPYSPLIRTPNFERFKNRMNTSFLPRYNGAELLTLSPGVGFVDTHCHLDFLFKRARHSGSYETYRRILKKYFPISYEACVAVFCDPHTFPMKSMWKPIIEEDGVWAAFGCHPHNAMDYDEIFDESLINALKHKKVQALGEIGLDYSNRNNCQKEVQHRVFRRQLKLAIDRNMPLVIHCRDATDDCLKIMTEMVPRNHKIHLHCFTGDWDTAQRWFDFFPNLFMGITNVVTYPSATCVHEVVKNMPLERLLLETDAPYFLPRTVPRSLRWSHPGMAIHVAAQITALRRNVNLEEVLITVRKNTYRMYNI